MKGPMRYLGAAPCPPDFDHLVALAPASPGSLAGNERSFPVCRLRRSDVADEPAPRLLKFTIRADPRLFGDEFRGIGTRQAEGNLWKAGDEPEAMLFGVSFIARNQILLNTIHIAEPGKITRSQLANGLSIETYPIPVSL
jgi:hypothetical protein